MILGGGFTSSRGTFGNVAKLCDMLCLSFGKTAEVTYSGGSDGNVFVWNGVTLQKTVKAHEGPLFAMHSLDKVNIVLFNYLVTVSPCGMQCPGPGITMSL